MSNAKAIEPSAIPDELYTKLSSLSAPYAQVQDIESIVSDSTGNIYTIGLHLGVVNFNTDGGRDLSTSDTYGSGHITKHDNQGNYLWTRQYPGHSIINSVIDNEDNIYFVWMDYTAELYNSAGSILKDIPQYGVTKVNSEGSIIWNRNLVTLPQGMGVEDLEIVAKPYERNFGLTLVDGEPNISFHYCGNIDFENTSTPNIVSVDNNCNFALIGLTSAGILGTITQWPAPKNNEPEPFTRSIVSNSNSIYLSFHYPENENFDLDPGPGEEIYNGNGEIIIALDHNYNYQYSFPYTNSYLQDFEVDVNGNLYTCVEIDGALSTVQKFNSNQALEWTKNITGRCLDLTVDTSGLALLNTIAQTGTYDINPDAGEELVQVEESSDVSYIVKLSPIGEYEWSYIHPDAVSGYRGKITFLGNRILTSLPHEITPPGGINSDLFRSASLLSLSNQGELNFLKIPGDVAPEDFSSSTEIGRSRTIRAFTSDARSNDLDPSSGEDIRECNQSCFYLSMFDDDNSYMFSDELDMGGNGPPIITSQVFDVDNNLYVSGTITATTDLDETDSEDIFDCASQFCSFITKYNSDGSYAWSEIINSPMGSLSTGIHAALDGTIYLSGFYMVSLEHEEDKLVCGMYCFFVLEISDIDPNENTTTTTTTSSTTPQSSSTTALPTNTPTTVALVTPPANTSPPATTIPKKSTPVTRRIKPVIQNELPTLPTLTTPKYKKNISFPTYTTQPKEGRASGDPETKIKDPQESNKSLVLGRFSVTGSNILDILFFAIIISTIGLGIYLYTKKRRKDNIDQ